MSKLDTQGVMFNADDSFSEKTAWITTASCPTKEQFIRELVGYDIDASEKEISVAYMRWNIAPSPFDERDRGFWDRVASPGKGHVRVWEFVKTVQQEVGL